MKPTRLTDRLRPRAATQRGVNASLSAPIALLLRHFEAVRPLSRAALHQLSAVALLALLAIGCGWPTPLLLRRLAFRLFRAIICQPLLDARDEAGRVLRVDLSQDLVG